MTYQGIAAFAAALTVALPISFGTGMAQTNNNRSNMDQRIGQLLEALGGPGNCGAKRAALDLTTEILYGGARPLPTPEDPDAGADGEGIGKATEGADEFIAERERQVAKALEQLALGGGGCEEVTGDALDLKFFIEEMNEVALAIGNVTRQCGNGADMTKAPCDQLRQRLNEEDGHIFKPGQGPNVITPGYHVKIRGPFHPRWMRGWEEAVEITDPIDPGQCVSVFKETKGLMLELRYDGFTTVADPWATPQLVRGTKVPIWRLHWVPSEYVKAFNMCNRDGRMVPITVHQRIKQDIGLNFFWRYYGK